RFDDACTVAMLAAGRFSGAKAAPGPPAGPNAGRLDSMPGMVSSAAAVSRRIPLPAWVVHASLRASMAGAIVMAPTVPAVGRAVPMLAVAVLFPTIAPAAAVPAAAVCVVTIAPGGMFRIRSAAAGTAPVTVPPGVVLPDCKIAD